MLDAIRSARPTAPMVLIDLPLTPLLDVTVLTSARGEPVVQHELLAEIPSAVRVDMLIAFGALERSATLARCAATPSR